MYLQFFLENFSPMSQTPLQYFLTTSVTTHEGLIWAREVQAADWSAGLADNKLYSI